MSAELKEDSWGKLFLSRWTSHLDALYGNQLNHSRLALDFQNVGQDVT